MTEEAADLDQEIDEAFVALRRMIVDRVRAEQLRDRLTGLDNDESLREWIQRRIEDGISFWLAFLEVDRFKGINDRFGYSDADELLKAVAAVLSESRGGWPETANVAAFRAHGDEFYLGGEWLEADSAEDLHRAIDLVRARIKGISIPATLKSGEAATMNCTVSVGWVAGDSLRAHPDELTERTVRAALELAVAEAKHERDRTVSYRIDMVQDARVDHRDDCPCGCKYSYSVPAAGIARNPRCPACGEASPRPVPTAASAPAAPPVGSVLSNPA